MAFRTGLGYEPCRIKGVHSVEIDALWLWLDFSLRLWELYKQEHKGVNDLRSVEGQHLIGG